MADRKYLEETKFDEDYDIEFQIVTNESNELNRPKEELDTVCNEEFYNYHYDEIKQEEEDRIDDMISSRWDYLDVE